jgi:hypothetical protein
MVVTLVCILLATSTSAQGLEDESNSTHKNLNIRKLDDPEESKDQPQPLNQSVAASRKSDPFFLGSPAQLTIATADISHSGTCTKAISYFCPDVFPAYARTAACLQAQVTAEDAGRSQHIAQVSGPCRFEVKQFYAQRERALSTHPGFIANCSTELRTICQYDGGLPLPGHVVGCLRQHKRKASHPCAELVLQEQLAAANDFSKDPSIAHSCSLEARRLCPGIPDGNGHMLACLHDKRRRVRVVVLGLCTILLLFACKSENANHWTDAIDVPALRLLALICMQSVASVDLWEE